NEGEASQPGFRDSHSLSKTVKLHACMGVLFSLCVTIGRPTGQRVELWGGIRTSVSPAPVSQRREVGQIQPRHILTAVWKKRDKEMDIKMVSVKFYILILFLKLKSVLSGFFFYLCR
ncbi:hypothetical protein XENOCAPTIV_012696, partial [Xenoophorus captivus]